jgi:hypothetical protein
VGYSKVTSPASTAPALGALADSDTIFDGHSVAVALPRSVLLAGLHYHTDAHADANLLAGAGVHHPKLQRRLVDCAARLRSRAVDARGWRWRRRRRRERRCWGSARCHLLRQRQLHSDSSVRRRRRARGAGDVPVRCGRRRERARRRRRSPCDCSRRRRGLHKRRPDWRPVCGGRRPGRPADWHVCVLGRRRRDAVWRWRRLRNEPLPRVPRIRTCHCARGSLGGQRRRLLAQPAVRRLLAGRPGRL